MLKTTVEYKTADGSIKKVSVNPTDADVLMVAEATGWKPNIPDPNHEKKVAAKAAQYNQLIADDKKDTQEFVDVANALESLRSGGGKEIPNPESAFEFVAKGLLSTGQSLYIKGKQHKERDTLAAAEKAKRDALIAESEAAMNRVEES